MKISRITVYRVDLPLTVSTYQLSGGRSYSSLDNTVVAVETNEGVTGWGEFCPWGSNYAPAFAGGTRAALDELGATLIGEDPCQLESINRHMDHHLKGHDYAKTAIDFACWDILGKVSGFPVYVLLGGGLSDRILANSSTPVDTVERMTERFRANCESGLRLHSVKLGGEPELDIERIRAVASLTTPGDLLTVDCNGGWLAHEALRVLRAVDDVDLFVEEPCATYAETLVVRERTRCPFILDESADSLSALVRAHQDRACDVVKFKISRFGGLTRARIARDFCVAMGLSVWIQESGGCELSGAAIAHLARSTPQPSLLGALWCPIHIAASLGTSSLALSDGQITVSDTPGLGVEPSLESLGDPVAVYQ